MKGVRATAQRLLLAESPWTKSLASMLSESRPSFLHRVPAHALTYTHSHSPTHLLTLTTHPSTHSHPHTHHSRTLTAHTYPFTCVHLPSHAHTCGPFPGARLTSWVVLGKQAIRQTHLLRISKVNSALAVLGDGAWPAGVVCRPFPQSLGTLGVDGVFGGTGNVPMTLRTPHGVYLFAPVCGGDATVPPDITERKKDPQPSP